MKVSKEWWIGFLKKASLALTTFYLFLPIIHIFIPLNQFESEVGFILFLVVVSLLALLIPFWYICLPLQLGTVFYTYQQYFPLSESGVEWLKINFEQQSRALAQFTKGGLAIFPTSVAFFFVLILIALSAFLLINQMKPSLAILTCLIYLMILHVFTQYDFLPSIVQVLGFSILAIGISQIPTKKGGRAALLSFLVITVSGFLFTQIALWATGNLLTQQRWVEGQARTFQEKLERDGFFDWVDYYSSGGGLRRMGYSENDSKLGGPLKQTFEKVFTSSDSTPHYWLISTKDVYTGQGWEQGTNDEAVPVEGWFRAPVSDQEFLDLEIDRTSDFDFYPYSYQTFAIEFDGEEMNSDAFQISIPSMKISWEGTEAATNSYILHTSGQEMDFSRLAGTSFTPENLQGTERYLALPENLPERVWELAESITADKASVYDQVRAIEEYLSSDSNLRYSLREAAYLPEGEDYVDHFLFESKVGYCDNFSTSMVVLARMMGIPARWAKGFNRGIKREDKNGDIHYEITNANAHSWPEIFFPEYGWIPFEPTPAFSQPLTNRETSTDVPFSEGEFILEQDQNFEEREEREPNPSSDTEASDESEIESTSIPFEDLEQSKKDSSENNLWLQFIAFLIPVMTIAIFLFRKKLYPLLVQQLVQISFFDVQLKSKMIVHLFQISERKEPSQTIREYFDSIANKLPMQKQVIQDFILLNEAFLYAPIEEANLNKIKPEKIFLNMITVFHDLKTLHSKSSF